jgi:hypothetical protein
MTAVGHHPGVPGLVIGAVMLVGRGSVSRLVADLAAAWRHGTGLRPVAVSR